MKGEGEETFAQLAQYYVDNLRENEGYCGGAGQDGKGDTCGQPRRRLPFVCDIGKRWRPFCLRYSALAAPSACGMSDAGLTGCKYSGAARACLKIHSRHLHAPLCGIFGPNSVNVARYASLIGTKSPTV